MAKKKESTPENASTEKKEGTTAKTSLQNLSNKEKETETSIKKEQSDENDHSKQIRELKELTNSLISTVNSIQARSEKDKAYFDTLSEIKFATKALTMPKVIQEDPDTTKKENCLSPCECVSENCCAFDIMLTEVRVSSMQFEPTDSNLGSMEIRIYAHVDGVGSVVPGMFSTLTLHKPIGSPALWTTVNTKVREVTIPNNTTKSFLIKIEAKEVEHTLIENLLYLRDEHGAGNGTLALNCCCASPEITVEIPFTAGGLGAGRRGSIEVRFKAVKKC